MRITSVLLSITSLVYKTERADQINLFALSDKYRLLFLFPQQYFFIYGEHQKVLA